MKNKELIMEKVNVRYPVEERVRYSNTVEMDKKEFDDLNSLDDKALSEALLDVFGRNDPTDWDAQDCDEFELVNNKNQ